MCKFPLGTACVLSLNRYKRILMKIDLSAISKIISIIIHIKFSAFKLRNNKNIALIWYSEIFHHLFIIVCLSRGFLSFAWLLYHSCLKRKYKWKIFCFRATFLLDPDMNVVSIQKCDIPVGLNIGEQLRQVQVFHIHIYSSFIYLFVLSLYFIIYLFLV